ncbi:MAG TPA: cob(I)yrinic acid a,c-diamide adenosyltransferase [Phycisphaerae bacterium]|nr:cob(I)yrinic acid a,c-diamide adenosyltransferase [Phycisphaerales bacterium]HNO78928.1 cob(I)yrinic acid a,c-diamide adenosyltransferase [Phycisphaerae bacterium]
MKIYTKTGDDGNTGLIGGARVPKDHARVACYGVVDELNAAIGWVVVACDVAEWRDALQQIQNDLFVLGTELATADGDAKMLSLQGETIPQLESQLDALMAEVEPLKNFVLPGGCELAARFHVARTVCRRAEREVVHLSAQASVSRTAVIYLNRLSDLLFAYSLGANHRAGVANIIWIAPKV